MRSILFIYCIVKVYIFIYMYIVLSIFFLCVIIYNTLHILSLK